MKAIQVKNLFSYQIIGLILLGALAFGFYAEYVLGYAPCHYCVYQRYLLGASGFVFLILPRLHLFGFAILALALTLALYQLGLEHKWWHDVLERCLTSMPTQGGLTRESLRAMLNDAPIVRCDQVNWRIFGYSAVLWNVVFNGCILTLYILGRCFQNRRPV